MTQTLRYQNVGILTGYRGSGATHWQRWLERKCRRYGAETVFPLMPERFGSPKLSAWLEGWRRVMPLIDETTALVGHSLGCQTILHRLAKDDGIKEVGLIVLVAPVTESRVRTDTDRTCAFFKNKKNKESVLEFLSGLDPQAARKARRLEIFTTNNDMWVDPEEALRLALEMQAHFHIIPGGGHLGATHHKFPEVLDLLVSR